jgi:ATP-binding cassette subfamily F protein 3
LVISHDRELLNRSVTGILHLTDQKLSYYTGTYDQFDAERRMQLEQQQSMKRKQDAQRAHIQAYVDRFRYKASKARQAQSRLKLLEKMQPIAGVTENRIAEFHFPAPDELPPPLVTIEGGSVGYDGTPVLQNMNLRLDQDDRIALLGANGEGKSTLSKLLAGRMVLMDGKLTKPSKLRVGFFAQHQLDELVEGETPFQHMVRLRPDEGNAQIRSRLGAAGIGADIVENPVERLSGGQKARLLMAMAAIDAPHILILDEPTNHLDIESREALVHALNDFPGAVILVSHDPHLVETVADRLWLVQGGAVAVFEGDIEDYKTQLLSQRSGRGGKKGKVIDAPKKPGRSAQERRRETAPLRSAVKKAEKQIAALEKRQQTLEARLADPTFYEQAESIKIETMSRELADIKADLAQEEENWLLLQEELEEALAD